MADYEAMKRRAAGWAVDQVDDGMTVGLGTGSTAAAAIEALGQAVADGREVVGVPTSAAARRRALAAGITVADLDAVASVDIAIDGADQVADGVLLKGGGGAHTRERLVAHAAERFLVVVDERKPVSAIDRAVPLEVLPAARTTVAAAVDAMGGTARERGSDAIDGPVYTERGNLLIDAAFGTIDDPAGLAARLWALPGVIDHGLFLDEADLIVIGRPDGLETMHA